MATLSIKCGVGYIFWKLGEVVNTCLYVGRIFGNILVIVMRDWEGKRAGSDVLRTIV